MTTPNDGLSIVYLPVNQAYLVMWNDQRLKGPVTKNEAEEYVDSLRSGYQKEGN